MIFEKNTTNISKQYSMKLREFKTVSDRRRALEHEFSLDLKNLGNFSIDEKTASTRNCENMVGVVQVPLGVAGPLKIKDNDYYVPLATTEGALVASVNRGCKAISLSGGANVVIKKIGITRAPVFKVKNISQAAQFIKNCDEHFDVFKKIAEKTSSHLKLISIKPWMVGRNVFLRFSYDTDDAMGMNMATIATAAVVQHIEAKTKIKCVALSGNMCVDKKPNFLNFIEGRGFSVWADVILPKEIISAVLKTNAEKIYEVFKSKIIYGSIMSGSIGANAHTANILSAIFLATGQDLGHISEASAAVTSVEIEDENLYFSIYIPDLPIGAVGGGTGLGTQKEALSILGIKGGNEGKSSIKLAEIIAGVALAGEISLIASLAENSLACAHQELARGGK